MQTENKISIEKQGDVTLLTIEGDITSRSERCLNDAYREFCSHGTNRMLLKFSKDVYINSKGIVALIQLFSTAKKKNTQAGILGLSGHYQKIFKMMGITKLAGIYETVEDALAQMP